MTTLGTVTTIGVAALIVGAGVGLYIVSKRKSESYMDFDDFREKCISFAKQNDSTGVTSAVIVIDLVDDNVIPSLYRKFDNGKVTRLKINLKPFPYHLLPTEVKDSFNNGQAILTKI